MKRKNLMKGLKKKKKYMPSILEKIKNLIAPFKEDEKK